MSEDYKVKSVLGDPGRSSFRKYRDIVYGDTSLTHVLVCEALELLFSWVPGALGLAMRQIFYPLMFKSVGTKVVFGRNVTVRHGRKISIGDNVVIDDNAVIDAKGETNKGLTIEDGVYIGRNTIVYCKNGDIHIERAVNISSNCQVFSSNSLTIGRQTVIGAYTYILSGGEYDYTDKIRTFAEQSGMNTKGPLTIGPNCWISAGVVVVDAANIGEHCVIGAGAVVTKPVPAHSLAVGVPARVVQSIA